MEHPPCCWRSRGTSPRHGTQAEARNTLGLWVSAIRSMGYWPGQSGLLLHVARADFICFPNSQQHRHYGTKEDGGKADSAIQGNENTL